MKHITNLDKKRSNTTCLMRLESRNGAQAPSQVKLFANAEIQTARKGKENNMKRVYCYKMSDATELADKLEEKKVKILDWDGMNTFFISEKAYEKHCEFIDKYADAVA